MTVKTIDIKRADERGVTEIDWLLSRHSFSFGGATVAGPRHHGLLIVSNDDIIQGGSGFGMHPHRDMEIVTWVLEGKLEHEDTTGTHDTIYPGLAQKMSAGTGIYHSEINPEPDQPGHFVQMWVLPDAAGVEPSYEQRDMSERLKAGGLFVVASGRGHEGAIGLRQRDAVLWAGRLTAGQRDTIPAAPFVHLFVARGSVELEDAGRLDEGDAARLTDAGPLAVTAGDSGAELLVWEFHREVAFQ
jgi:quercetin 2,3-dioxygenase